jgi:hypothetical protein
MQTPVCAPLGESNHKIIRGHNFMRGRCLGKGDRAMYEMRDA